MIEEDQSKELRDLISQIREQNLKRRKEETKKEVQK